MPAMDLSSCPEKYMCDSVSHITQILFPIKAMQFAVSLLKSQVRNLMNL